MQISPRFRIVLLLLLAIFLPQISSAQMLALTAVFLMGCFLNQTLAVWGQTFLRLKWLFLSIVILNGWFTPGLPIIELAGVRMPTQEGLWLATDQVLLLAALVAAVMWLIKPMAASVIASALASLLQPLRYCGVDIEAFSRRTALTLHYVAHFQDKLSSRPTHWDQLAAEQILAVENGQLTEAPHDGDPLLMADNWRTLAVFMAVLLSLSLVAVLARVVQVTYA